MARKPRKPIPDAELAVLQALWAGGPGNVREVLERLKGDERAYTTVQTLLNRLETKGYVRSRKDGRALVYEAAVEREDVLAEELRDVASRVTGGRTSPLVMNLVENTDLSEEDVRRLRALLDRLESKRRPRKG